MAIKHECDRCKAIDRPGRSDEVKSLPTHWFRTLVPGPGDEGRGVELCGACKRDFGQWFRQGAGEPDGPSSR